MKTRHPVLKYIRKTLFIIISSNKDHPWHALAVHECVNGVDVYYIRA